MNLLPTLSNLLARGLAHGSLNCVHCLALTEDIKHSLFLCDWAQDIWASVELNYLTNQTIYISIEDVLCATQERQKGLGFVVRSHSESVLVARSKRVNFATSVVEAEAKAILWAIQVALAKGFIGVALETDSSILVEAFKHDQVLVPIRALFLYIRRLCLLFNSCTLSFVRREGNRVAHELARKASNDSIDVYDGFVPLSIEP
ncbi:reverse transcriptase [Tanacetum coccineum]